MSSVSGNYPTPVTVNGYSCKNCTDVGLAKKHIDPAHPKSGPYGINAKDDPSVRQDTVTFGGVLKDLSASTNDAQTRGGNPARTGQQVDLLA